MKIFLFRAWNWLVISSEDPEKFSARFLGLVTAFSGLIAIAISYFGPVTSADQVISWAGQATTAGGIIYSIFGLIRYISNMIDKKVPLV